MSFVVDERRRTVRLTAADLRRLPMETRVILDAAFENGVPVEPVHPRRVQAELAAAARAVKPYRLLVEYQGALWAMGPDMMKEQTFKNVEAPTLMFEGRPVQEQVPQALTVSWRPPARFRAFYGEGNADVPTPTEPRRVLPEPLVYRPHQANARQTLRERSYVECWWDRRTGKTVFAARELVDAAKARVGHYGYIAQTFDGARLSVWDYLGQLAGAEALAANRPQGRLTLHNGSTIQLYASFTTQALRGIALAGVVLDDVRNAPRVFAEHVRPALLDRMGWAIIAGS